MNNHVFSYAYIVSGGYAQLQELSGSVVSQVYKITWERERLDLTELARLRWVERWVVSHKKITCIYVAKELHSIQWKR